MELMLFRIYRSLCAGEMKTKSSPQSASGHAVISVVAITSLRRPLLPRLHSTKTRRTNRHWLMQGYIRFRYRLDMLRRRRRKVRW